MKVLTSALLFALALPIAAQTKPQPAAPAPKPPATKPAVPALSEDAKRAIEMQIERDQAIVTAEQGILANLSDYKVMTQAQTEIQELHRQLGPAEPPTPAPAQK